jgi:hypothetical protein
MKRWRCRPHQAKRGRILAIAVALCACGSSAPAPTISPDSVVVRQGDAVVFTLSGDARDVQWSVTEGPQGGVIEGGKYTAPRQPGTFHVVATTGNGRTAGALVNVPPLEVEMSPAAATVLTGGVARFHPSINAAGEEIALSVVPESSGTIDATGMFLAGSTPGQCTVVAKNSRTGASASAAVDVVGVLPGGADLMRSANPAIHPSPTLHVHSIWWGNPAGFPPDAEASIEKLVRSLNGSRYLDVVNQYLEGATADITYAGSVHDEDSSPPDPYGDAATVAGEFERVLARGSFPPPTDQDLYIVFGSIPLDKTVTRGVRCGWHSFDGRNGERILIAYVASFAGSAGVCAGKSVEADCSTTDPYTNTMTLTTAHELFETITNGVGGTWLDAEGEEVADKCPYLTCLPVGDGVQALQPLFSNAVHGCVSGF